MLKTRFIWIATGMILFPLAGCNTVGEPAEYVVSGEMGPGMGAYYGGGPFMYGPSYGDFGDFGGYGGLGYGMYMGDDDDD